MIMSFEGYQQALESQKQNEDELKMIKDQQQATNEMLQKIITTLSLTTDQTQINAMAKSLGVLKPNQSTNNNSN